MYLYLYIFIGQWVSGDCCESPSRYPPPRPPAGVRAWYECRFHERISVSRGRRIKMWVIRPIARGSYTHTHTYIYIRTRILYLRRRYRYRQTWPATVVPSPHRQYFCLYTGPACNARIYYREVLPTAD